MTKIFIPFPDVEHSAIKGESVWAEEVAENKYELRNWPLSDELGWGDTVLAKHIDGRLTFVERLHKYVPAKNKTIKKKKEKAQP